MDIPYFDVWKVQLSGVHCEFSDYWYFDNKDLQLLFIGKIVAAI